MASKVDMVVVAGKILKHLEGMNEVQQQAVMAFVEKCLLTTQGEIVDVNPAEAKADGSELAQL